MPLQTANMKKHATLVPVERVFFDADNIKHRQAAMTFLDTGKWTIMFKTRRPMVPVPQEVLTELARFACRNDQKVSN